MKVSLLREVFRRPRGAVVSGVLLLMYGLAMLAPFFSPYSPATQNLDKFYHPPTGFFWGDEGIMVKRYELADASSARYEAIPGEGVPVSFFSSGYEYKLLGVIPCDIHFMQLDGGVEGDRLYLLGSDETGRDVFTRLLHGAQISLSIGLVGISITMIMGFLVGGLAGYFGGKFDAVAMRFVEFLMAIPGLYLLLSLRSALAQHFDSAQMYLMIVIVLAFIGWAGSARVIRGMALSLRSRAFVEASGAMGQNTLAILVKHFLPNLASYLLIAATLSIPSYILGEAALSFLGLGIQEPSASWGLMLSQVQDLKVFYLNFWWLLTPGLMIFITVICFNILGDTLRDIVDPRFGTGSKG